MSNVPRDWSEDKGRVLPGLDCYNCACTGPSACVSTARIAELEALLRRCEYELCDLFGAETLYEDVRAALGTRENENSHD